MEALRMIRGTYNWLFRLLFDLVCVAGTCNESDELLFKKKLELIKHLSKLAIQTHAQRNKKDVFIIIIFFSVFFFFWVKLFSQLSAKKFRNRARPTQ